MQSGDLNEAGTVFFQKGGALQPILTGYKTPELAINAVYPQRKQLAPKVRAFVDYAAECFGPEPYRDQALRAPKTPRRRGRAR